MNGKTGVAVANGNVQDLDYLIFQCYPLGEVVRDVLSETF